MHVETFVLPIYYNMTAKKLFIAIALVALLGDKQLKAQVKIFNNNEVQVGALWWPTFPSTKQLFINGGLEVREFPGSGMYIQNYNNFWNGAWYDDPSIVSHFNYGGWVGTPSQAMFAVYTNLLYAAGVQITSDERMKTNITRLQGAYALEKIKLINAYRYDYNEKMYRNAEDKKRNALINSGKNQIGFVAQELVNIVPEAVKADDSTGLYSVNYIMLIPIMVEAIKEQQKLISELQQQVLDLQNK
jgi:hypothetical protein